jgi:hypothetical protein
MESNDKVDKPVPNHHPVVRWLLWLVYLFFPLVLLGIGYFVGVFIPAFNRPVFDGLPIDALIWPPLVVLIVLALLWLLFDLFWVVDRETTSRHLQLYGVASVSRIMAFSMAFGYLFNSKYGIAWWFVIPFIAVVVDAFTTGWAAINNATQKPFLSDKGKI